uniref:Uncharacterized protein n=1 Tax=Brassica oleracea TaxID=3712 RepID=A0A3P6CQ59_BRAOL|nr:unnamed protein product [Brassica oleracea]
MNESVAEEKNEHVTEKENEPVADGNDDNGDDVVQDVGDGGDDGIFKAVFEEGSMAKIDKEEYKNFEEKKEEAKREAEESEEEGVIEEDADYPDTPLESDEEWKQWDKEKEKRDGKRKSKFHGNLEKEPYFWLFQKFNSGLEFKDQLLKYSLKTQFDVKMARSDANRIAVALYCSFEPPINKWMVKVCQLCYNHGKSSRVSMLKQGMIASLFREELRRNISLPAAVIKDTTKER